MRTILLATSMLLAACDSSSDTSSNNNPDVGTEFSTEFKDGANGWSVGFSDYPIADADIFDFASGINPVPGHENHIGLLTSGHNRSDDLFMFVKRQIQDLSPNTRYLMTAEATIWSDAGNFCGGIGGAPGESVFMKAGASEVEPEQADYYMNIDIGNQSQEGSDAKVLGHIGVDGAVCEGGVFGSKQIALAAEMDFEIISSTAGDIWVFIGSDSGFEGKSSLYYENITVKFTPVQ